MSSAPLILAENITMRFGSVTALEDVSLAADAGAITCLLGDNGAGKSTLIRILSGVIRPTAGRLIMDGAQVLFRSPRDALAHGIATVHQDLALVPLLSAWRNFFLGTEPTIGKGLLRRIDGAGCRAAALEALEELGIALVDADQPVATMSGGQRQAIAIGRAVHRGARVLILDEPTAALGVAQRRLVTDLIRRVRDRGVAVILITHDPAQADALADRRVVLERGRIAAT